MDVIISAPFYPAYMTRERIEKAPNLKLAITAGVGSDHVDLAAASELILVSLKLQEVIQLVWQNMRLWIY